MVKMINLTFDLELDHEISMLTMKLDRKMVFLTNDHGWSIFHGFSGNGQILILIMLLQSW